jgi:hypothetical protein
VRARVVMARECVVTANHFAGEVFERMATRVRRAVGGTGSTSWCFKLHASYTTSSFDVDAAYIIN